MSQTPDVPVYDNFEDAVASWVQDACAMEPVSVWLTPKVKFSVKLPQGQPPSVLVGRLVKDAETGKFWFLPMAWPFLMRLSEVPRRLGLPINERILSRLIYAGLVKGCRISHSHHLVDIGSLWEHLQATSGPDGESFWTPDRKERYSEAVSVIRRGSNKRRAKPVMN